MSSGKVTIALAAGIDDVNHPYGTDPLHIARVVEEVYTTDGVVLMTDIGSAVMNAEIAQESLPEVMRQHVILSSAPFVEGTIAAVAQAAAGASLAEVIREAESVLQGKEAAVGTDQYFSFPDDIAVLSKEKNEFRITVPNKLGLHARPAARLVDLLHSHPAKVRVRKEGALSVNAKSISQVATLKVKKGDVLIFEIFGNGSEEIKTVLAQFTAANFGDFEEKTSSDSFVVEAVSEAVDNTAGVITGTPAAAGIYVGIASVASNSLPDLSVLQAMEPAAEWDALGKAVKKVINQYESARKRLGSKDQDKEIFAFPLLLLRDQELLDKIKRLLITTGETAARMWQVEMVHLEKEYLKGDSIYLRERAGDIREISRKVILALVGQSTNTLLMSTSGVLVLDDIGPGEVAELNTELVKGIITARGGRTSHASILARSLDIPCIVGIGEAIELIENGASIAMDGTTGNVLLADATDERVVKLIEQQQKEAAQRKELRKEARRPAVTLDGATYPVLANVSSAAEAATAYRLGADGVGLLRTEFLYMNRETAPSEEEQYLAYKAICKEMNGLPVTIRTLDVGGDKQLPYLRIPAEKNPYLGLRGIRYCLYDQALFRSQLRAICRVAAHFPVKLMYPMVSVVEEVMSANIILDQVLEELELDGHEYARPIQTGIMVEVPSTAFCLPELAKVTDFFSIGTNDLTQYLLARERGNEMVADYHSPLHPSVLEALRHIISESRRLNVEVAMCGELAGNPKATKFLLHMGLNEFSMSGPSIPAIKDIIRQTEGGGHLTHSEQNALRSRTLEAVSSALAKVS